MMNSLVPSLRTALRAGSAPVWRNAPWAAAYSTAPQPTPAPVASSSSSSASSSSSGAAALDNVIASIKASQGARAAPRAGHIDPFARRGGDTAHAAVAQHLLQSTPSPRSLVARPATPEETWAHTPPVPYSLPVTTTSARSFAVRDGNVARAYRTLSRVLNDNNIRRELKRQERFEGPSSKRVRLNSERHRRRFKVAVGKAVSLAMRMKDL